MYARLCDICEREATLYNRVDERRRETRRQVGQSASEGGGGRGGLGPELNGGEVEARWWSDGVESGDVTQVDELDKC